MLNKTDVKVINKLLLKFKIFTSSSGLKHWHFKTNIHRSQNTGLSFNKILPVRQTSSTRQNAPWRYAALCNVNDLPEVRRSVNSHWVANGIKIFNLQLQTSPIVAEIMFDSAGANAAIVFRFDSLFRYDSLLAATGYSSGKCPERC